MKTNHTPGPWASGSDTLQRTHPYIVGPDGRSICALRARYRTAAERERARADRDRILLCVNTHDELMRHLTEIVTLARHPAISGSGEWKRMPVELRSAVADAERALAAMAAGSPA